MRLLPRSSVPGGSECPSSDLDAHDVQAGRARALSRSPYSIVKVDDAAPFETSFIDELERQSQAVRERRLATADDDRRNEEVDLVDEARPESVRRELMATDHQVTCRSRLHLANAAGVERLLESRPRHR